MTEAHMDDRRRTDRRAPGREGGRRRTDPQPEWVSVSDYARIYGVDRGTVHKWLRCSLLLTYRVGWLRRIRNVTPDLHAELLRQQVCVAVESEKPTAHG